MQGSVPVWRRCLLGGFGGVVGYGGSLVGHGQLLISLKVVVGWENPNGFFRNLPYYRESWQKAHLFQDFQSGSPSERVVEQRVIDTLRRVFELNGFIGIETRAVEQGSSLLKKGETSKEIYLLSRLQEVGHESDTPVNDRLGLHFDLTVPLSRYVVEHSGDLAFPFKRWQIQKVWRGERPQEGRFREFVQADIDVIGNGDLPDHYEVELPLVMVSALEELRAFGLPKATVHANTASCPKASTADLA